MNPETLPTLVACLLHATDALKLKIKTELEETANLRVLLDLLRAREPYEAEHVIFIVWGGVEKLQAAAAKAKGETAGLLAELAGFAISNC
ncbi:MULTISPECIES: DUF6138 family protein [Brevibacillus]|uniref:DUF6138 family protein n=1 Tax=Brevibacillus TaxID=55080 RepID=UPI0027D97BD9|nr:DUF6138 family protein [Brevibacillus agri]